MPPIVLQTTNGALRHGFTGAPLKAADYFGRFEPLLSSVGIYHLVHHTPLHQHAEHPNVMLSLAASGAWKVQEGMDYGEARPLLLLARRPELRAAPPKRRGVARLGWQQDGRRDAPARCACRRAVQEAHARPRATRSAPTSLS